MADSEEVSVSNDSEPLLSVRHLRKSYGDHEVLKDVSFDVKRGQVLVLLGPSGSGKSTLIRCLNGLETIQGGEIWFKGQKIANNSEKTWRKLRAEIGMVFQSFNLFPHLTVFGNLLLAPRYHQLLDQPVAREQALALLDRVGLLAHAHKYPGQLSGGQQQRVAIARALALKPDIMLFDEPTSAPPRCRSARRPRSPSRWISCWPTCSSPNTRTRTRANCQEARNSASPLCVRLR